VRTAVMVMRVLVMKTRLLDEALQKSEALRESEGGCQAAFDVGQVAAPNDSSAAVDIRSCRDVRDALPTPLCGILNACGRGG
jgi:hypothetical protein